MTLLINPSGLAHLASGALPAAGANTSQAAAPITPHHKAITVSTTYTRGAAGGFVRLTPMWTIGGAEVQGTVKDEMLDTSTAPYGQQSIYQHQVNGPQPQSASALTFPFTFEVPAGATAFRALAAEAGVTGTPGTCSIALSGLVDL